MYTNRNPPPFFPPMQWFIIMGNNEIKSLVISNLRDLIRIRFNFLKYIQHLMWNIKINLETNELHTPTGWGKYASNSVYYAIFPLLPELWIWCSEQVVFSWPDHMRPLSAPAPFTVKLEVCYKQIYEATCMFRNPTVTSIEPHQRCHWAWLNQGFTSDGIWFFFAVKWD